MGRNRVGIYGKLNVVAHPHPAGIYRKIFDEAAKAQNTVEVRRNRFARIGKISQSRDDIFSGVIAFWTDIPENSPALKKSSLDEESLRDLGVVLPEGVGFDSRVFTFSFNERTHTLAVELKNNERETVTINTLRKALFEILKRSIPEEVNHFDIFVISSSVAVDEIIKVEQIRTAHIVINLPNPDGIDDKIQERVEKKRRQMEEANVKREEIRLTKERGAESIEFGSGAYRAELELAAQNGFARVNGKTAGRSVSVGTDDFPDIIKETLGEAETSAVVTRRIVSQ